MSGRGLRRYDVCVVGAGAMGLYIAARLGTAGLRVALVEGGELTRVHTARRLNQIGDPEHLGIRNGWSTGLGGTTQLWGGQLWPWSPEDFAGDAEAGVTAWDVTAADEALDNYAPVRRRLGLSTTHDRIHLGDAPFSPSAPWLHGATLKFSSWMSPSERHFAQNRALMTAAPHCDLYASHVSDIRPHAAGWELQLWTQSGIVAPLRSRTVILAAGTLGNVFLLRGAPELPVGRDFSDHLSSRVAEFAICDLRRFTRSSSPIYERGVRASPRLVLPRQPGLLPGFGHWEVETPDWLDAEAARSAINARRPRHVLPAIAPALPHLPSAARALAAARGSRRPVLPGSRVFLRVDIPQARSETRRLTAAADEQTLRWSVSTQEREAIRQHGARLIECLDLDAIGLRLVSTCEQEPRDTFHLMGGTPMSTDGVVDPDGQVKGRPGLFCAGASVFPSGGLANPTFTALSLAEGLVRRTIGGSPLAVHHP